MQTRRRLPRVQGVSRPAILSLQDDPCCGYHDRMGIAEAWRFLSRGHGLEAPSLTCVTCSEWVVSPPAVLRFVHFLHRGDERPVLRHPSLPAFPGLIGRPEIVRF